MASKREAKKKIKNEYRRLEEDILQYMKVGSEKGKEKSKEMLAELKQASDTFVKELNNTEQTTNAFFTDISKRVIDDVDKKYKALKELVTQK